MRSTGFATAINCMDGRVQIPVIEWLKGKCVVDYVDMITEPGVDGILAEGRDVVAIESIKKKVEISVNKHSSGVVAVVGHHDCAGNSLNRETHLSQIISAVRAVESWGFGVQVIGLWIDENWEVQRV